MYIHGYVMLIFFLSFSECGSSPCFVISGNYTGAYYYNEARQEREEIFDEMFWNETTGTWRDFDLSTNRHLDGLYLSSVAPLVWQCGSSNISRQLSTLSYLKVS